MALSCRVDELSNHQYKKPGPQTRNAPQHGASVKHQMPADEDQEERRRLHDQHLSYYGPSSGPELQIVSELADKAWHHRQLDKTESALVERALIEAKQKYPTPVRNLAGEVHNMDLELCILGRLMNRLRTEIRKEDGCAEAVLVGLAPVLDRLIGRTDTVTDTDVASLVVEMQRILQSRKQIVETARKDLNDLLVQYDTVITAVKAEASLLKPKVRERLSKERRDLERTSKHLIEMLHRMRRTESDGRILKMSSRMAGLAHKEGGDAIRVQESIGVGCQQEYCQ